MKGRLVCDRVKVADILNINVFYSTKNLSIKILELNFDNRKSCKT